MKSKQVKVNLGQRCAGTTSSTSSICPAGGGKDGDKRRAPRPPRRNDVVLMSFMKALRIKRVTIMKPRSTASGKTHQGASGVAVLWRLLRAQNSSPRLICGGWKVTGCCNGAGHDHPTFANEGRLNEQMVNEDRLNCPSEIIYCLHLLLPGDDPLRAARCCSVWTRAKLDSLSAGWCQSFNPGLKLVSGGTSNMQFIKLLPGRGKAKCKLTNDLLSHHCKGQHMQSIKLGFHIRKGGSVFKKTLIWNTYRAVEKFMPLCRCQIINDILMANKGELNKKGFYFKRIKNRSN